MIETPTRSMSQTPTNEKRRNYRFYAGDPYEIYRYELMGNIYSCYLVRFIQQKNDCMLMEISKE